MLPGINISKGEWVDYSKGYRGAWSIDHWWDTVPGLPFGYNPKESSSDEPEDDLNEAELRAAFLIWLLEKGHTTAEAVNARLADPATPNL